MRIKNTFIDNIQKVSINILLNKYYTYFLLFYPVIFMLIFKTSYQIIDCLESETNIEVSENTIKEEEMKKNPILGSFLFLTSIGIWFYFFGGVDGSSVYAILESLSIFNGEGSTSFSDSISDTSSIYSQKSEILGSPKCDDCKDWYDPNKGYPEEKNSLPPNSNLETNKDILFYLNKTQAEINFRDMLFFHNIEQSCCYTEIEKEHIIREAYLFQNRCVDHHIKNNFENVNFSEEDRIGFTRNITEEFMKSKKLRYELFKMFCKAHPNSEKIMNNHTDCVAEILGYDMS